MAFKDWSTTPADNDDADVSINWAEGQAPSTVNGSARQMMATLKTALGHIISIKDYGAIGDGSTDDTQSILDAFDAANTVNGAVWVPAGEYKVTSALDLTSYFGVRVVGDGFNASPSHDNGGASRIIQHTNNTPILKVWGPCYIDGLYLAYNTQQSLSTSDSIALELNNISGAQFRNVRVYRANKSLGIPQTAFGATSTNIIFDSVLENIQSYEAYDTHFDLRGFNGGCTNVAVINPYFNGGGSSDFVTVGQDCNYVIRGVNWKGFHFDTMSIDGMTINQTPIQLDGNCMAVMGYVRFEAVKVTANTAVWIFSEGSHASTVIGTVELDNCRWSPSVATSMYVYNPSADCSVFTVEKTYIDTDCDFGSSGTRRLLLNSSTDSGTGFVSYIRIGPFEDQGTKLSDRVWTETSITTLLTPVQVWDGALVNERVQSGRTTTIRRRAYATAVPSTGTWVAGDEVIMVTATLGLPTAYKCTTGGTPGTWRMIAQTVKRDTTGNRPSPSASDVGLLYLDNTIDADGKAIWWNGTAWVDATGATV